MRVLSRSWAFLTNAENRATLVWLGGAVVAVSGGLAAILGPWRSPPAPAPRPPVAIPAAPAPHPAINAPGGVAANIINDGTFTIGPQPRP